jgi:hypothetical protein
MAQLSITTIEKELYNQQKVSHRALYNQIEPGQLKQWITQFQHPTEQNAIQ